MCVVCVCVCVQLAKILRSKRGGSAAAEDEEGPDGLDDRDGDTDTRDALQPSDIKVCAGFPHDHF